MQTLSYGFQLPQTGDKGPVIFPALEINIQQLNDHTHDGVNSAPLSASVLQSETVNIPASGWASYGADAQDFRQLVQMAPGFGYDTSTVRFKTAAGDYVYPTVARVSNSSYYVYCNDSTVSLVALHGG